MIQKWESDENKSGKLKHDKDAFQFNRRIMVFILNDVRKMDYPFRKHIKLVFTVKFKSLPAK
jgi:hypothetical protein